MNEAIVVDRLRFRYPDMERWVLDEVSLVAQPGETVLLLGPSGSGKSTLALCLNGLIPHLIEGDLQGDVLVWGRSTAGQPVSALCQQVGEVFQDPEAQLVMPRVAEEVAFGLENLALPPETMEARIEPALEQVGLLGRRQEWVEALSGGQKQRLALAAVLALRPSILVLDEPTANLDPRATREFFQTLRELKAGLEVTIILIEHRLEQALPLTDRVVVLNRAGRAVASGTPAEVFERYWGTLEQEGVWLPATCRLALALRHRGWPLAGCPLSVAEAELALASLLPRPPAVNSGDFVPVPAIPENTPPAVAVDDLHYAYPGRLPVLQGVRLRVAPGRFLALVGANGSGKTTLASHLVGLLRPDRGTVRVLGRDTGRQSPRQLAQQVGYVFQNPEHQFVTERVADELAYSLRGRWGEAETERRVQNLLQTFGLAGYAEANPFALSQGQKRRLSVATMVALEQPVLVLDEPTFGQDRHSAAALMGILKSLQAAGTTIVFISHDMQLVAEYANEVAVMVEGQVHFQGSPADLFRQPELLAAAGLDRPPLAELGWRLGRSDLLTVEDWLAWMELWKQREGVS